MGKDSRRRAKKESRQRRRIAVACAGDDTSLPPTSILDIPDDLLEHILLRVRTHACLFRAAATCKTWRCVVAGTSFLRRFRSLHGQDLLIGHYCVNIKKMEDGIERLNAEFFPCPPRPTNHLRQRLSLDFLPQPRPYSHSHQRVLTDRIVGSRAAGYVRIASLLGGGVLEVFTRFHGAWMCTMWGIADLCRLVNFEARPHQLWRFVDTDTITTPATVVLGAVLASSSVKLFSLDVDTMKLRRLDDMTTTLCAERVFPFELPWPQTISTCL